ncbi:NDR1/HIN1-like protein 6 [Chenopodium quinoa]|uniref:Late embryogenesis abundant protein LEA-2 subgroup domain-containing protein n=1 Tax=Chenopodium quinoa TaxID=63459 RepID=A0A803N0T4_CHEQI|nr:NDR1/HIN1-like protein 6 [Chenopodium quinoa]
MPSDRIPVNPRIYPTSIVIDQATKPTVPLVPRNSSISSDKGHTMGNNPPPYPQSLPPFRSLARQPKGRSCCCRVICCIFSLLATFLLVVGILALVFFLVFHPKVPSYSVDRLRITDFRLNLDLSLYARFNVRVTAKNPNKKIGIYYEKGGKMSVWYKKTNLCQGSFPAFYQSPLNTTATDVSLSGQNQYGNTLMQALQQQQQTGNIPLELKVDQPVSIKVQSMKLGKVRFLVNCQLTVDSLSSNNAISIKASNCKIRVKL